MAPGDEIELIGRARAGEQAAQDRLYREFFAESRSIRSLLNREISEPADREDVLHDAFLSLLRSGAEFRGDARLGTFVYRVVQIAILQKRRSDRARREHQMVRLTYDFQGEERERELAVEDYHYEQTDADATARKLYELVPEPLRTALRLRVSEELSYEEIAVRTAAPINTVSTRIFKARSLLSRLLNGDRPDSGGKKGGRSRD